MPVLLLGNVEAARARQLREQVPLLGQLVVPGVVAAGGDQPLLHADLVPPESVLVASSEAGDHDGDGQGQDEDPRDGAQAADELAHEGRGVHVVAHRGERHQPPPEAVVEGPAPGLGPLCLDGKDEAGVEQDGHNHDHKQQAQL